MNTATLKRIDGPPDTRGGTGPIPMGTFMAGALALGIILLGTFVVQLGYHFGGAGGMTPGCRAELTVTIAEEERLITGAEGVCNVVRGFVSPTQTAIVWTAIILGCLVTAVGLLLYKRMPSRRMRNQCISGTAMGVQAVFAAVVFLWFRTGDIFGFARSFMNFGILEGSLDGFILGAKNTMQLAILGELGGIILGLLLALFLLSNHRTVRAPARAYINFFRGTPLIFQLGFFNLLFAFGFNIRLDAFKIATLVFVWNTGAYAAEVFRAGIQSVERGQMEAARSLGMSYLQAMRYAIVPQAVRRVIPPLMNEFVILIKDTALVVVLGLLASQLEIYGFARQGQAATFNATFFTAAAVAYLVVTLPLIRLVNYVENRMRSGLTGRVG